MSGKITYLSPESWTPKYTLNAVLEDAEILEDIVIVLRYKNGDTETVNSHMTVERLAYLSKRLDFRVSQELYSASRE